MRCAFQREGMPPIDPAVDGLTQRTTGRGARPYVGAALSILMERLSAPNTHTHTPQALLLHSETPCMSTPSEGGGASMHTSPQFVLRA
mmetsp:Transcript_87067/g.261612  ORF Transcript_87067/g.261612 Transcript_87067/m.261612 type:complete len:88 (+) Transcript_87067:137-400(+)